RSDFGEAESRFVEEKVHKPKQVDLGPRIMLDDERCILCSRCIRFTREIVGDDALGFVRRGSYTTLTNYPGKPFDNNYTLNTVDICPVGALTSKDFRFQMRVWFLEETPSLCTSCGTGCNIIIGSRENKIYRYSPRANDAVNSCWMCDAGRLNYRWIDRPDRLSRVQRRDPKGNVEPVDWPAALDEISAFLRAAAPGSTAIIASNRQTNEELFLLHRLAAKIEAITDSIPQSGPGDKLLVSTDKNPNSNGALLAGIAASPPGSNLPRILEGIRQGRVRVLVVFGEEITRHGFTADLLDRLEKIVVSDILPNRTAALAHYLLPGCAHAEKQGTFTNTKGRLQKFMPAVAPPGEARPEWQFLRELVESVTGESMPAAIEGLFGRMAEAVNAYRGLSWNDLGDHGVTVKI
ncbi:MAG: molybdopterin-dependent oxidoreductase, partial [Candidatus Omnitrophica bacterium]|nr:molybdopterin-dependent oxidoreductase [Candidatus Omnitrophota bacterium]